MLNEIMLFAVQLEVAYDTLLMQAMQKRIKGEVAGQSVRFADVPKRRPASQASRELPPNSL